MKLIGLSKDKETGEISQYELKIYKHEINCLYKDKYGVYVCTTQGKMHKVDYTLKELEELCL